LGRTVPQKEYFVRDVMTTPVVSITSKTSLLDAALLLRGSATRHLPVVEGGRLVGLLTDRDLQRCAPSRLIPITEDAYNEVFAKTLVERVMTRDPQTVSSMTSLREAVSQMQQTKYGCLPVVDNDALVGILTRGDLIDALEQLLSGNAVGRAALPSV
jgi:acetoin utilization protein AcuB